MFDAVVVDCAVAVVVVVIVIVGIDGSVPGEQIEPDRIGRQRGAEQKTTQTNERTQIKKRHAHTPCATTGTETMMQY